MLCTYSLYNGATVKSRIEKCINLRDVILSSMLHPIFVRVHSLQVKWRTRANRNPLVGVFQLLSCCHVEFKCRIESKAEAYVPTERRWKRLNILGKN